MGAIEEPAQAAGDVLRHVLAAVVSLASQLAVHPQRQMARPGQLQHLLFQHGIEFFEDDHIGQPLGKGRRRLSRERIRRPHSYEAVARHGDAGTSGLRRDERQRLASIGCRYAASHNTHRRSRRSSTFDAILSASALTFPAPFEHLVELRECGVVSVVPSYLGQPAIDLTVRLESPFGENDPLRILLETFFRQRATVSFLGHLEERGSMVDTRRGAHDDRRVVALGQLEGGLHHGKTLLGCGRIDHRHLREGAEPARVLLGLGGDRTRIVGHEQHAAAARAHVVQRHERIGSDIEPHLLAGEQHPRAAVGRAGQHLERRLLVRGPIPHARPGPRPPRAASPRFPPARTMACRDTPPPRSLRPLKPRGQTPRCPLEVSSP